MEEPDSYAAVADEETSIAEEEPAVEEPVAEEEEPAPSVKEPPSAEEDTVYAEEDKTEPPLVEIAVSKLNTPEDVVNEILKIMKSGKYDISTIETLLKIFSEIPEIIKKTIGI